MVDTLNLGAFHIAEWFQMVNVLHSGLSFKCTGYWLVNIESLWMVDSDKNVVSQCIHVHVPGDLILVAECFNAQPVAMDAHPAIYLAFGPVDVLVHFAVAQLVTRADTCRLVCPQQIRLLGSWPPPL